ncbi:hypothetical protein EDC96DRAFT_74495 [Choanephora cucurbitarum]|nr:hypothetical protein EDC96DRAFT_74495 [Choanephora cucurbitarum]
MGDIVGNKPLDLAVISNDVDTVLVLLEAGAHIHRHTTDNQSGLQTRLRAATRTPLDLANSRLDLLISQSNSTNRKSMDQVLKIIELLKHFVAPNEMDEITELTSKLACSETQKNEKDEDVFIMKSLKDVISRIKIE